MKTREEAMTYLKDFISRLNGQDNRATATPYIIVLQEKDRHPIPEECGYDESAFYDRTDGVTYRSKEHYMQAFGETEWTDRLEKSWDKDVQEVYFKTFWEDVAWFFTYEGLEDHLRLNKHNYGETRSYIKFCYRNPEIQNLLTAVGLLVETPYERK